jgi:hypothetical protein
MKYVKMLGLAAVAAMALMAFFGASSASAAVLCKTNSDPCEAGQDLEKGAALNSSLAAGKTAVLKAAFSEVVCSKSEVKGEVTNTGGKGKEVSGDITEITFTECTCGSRTAHVTTTEAGTLKVNDAGTVTSVGTRATIQCTGLASCIFGTVAAGTDVGTFTEGSPGSLNAAATLTWSSGTGDSGQFVCAGFGDTGSWTANYEVTSPTSLWVSNE